MKLTALTCVRNEQWVLEASLPAALELVDEVVVLDHNSTDATPDIVAQCARDFPGRVHAVGWDGSTWNETAIRQRTLDEARARGATHLFVLDADEILTANTVQTVRTAIGSLAPGECLELPWLAMWRSLDAFRHDDSVWSSNYHVFAFADAPRVRYAALDDGYDLHMRAPRGLVRPPVRPITSPLDGGLMHLQFAHRRRLIAKHAWYKMTERVRFPHKPVAEIDAMYNQAMDESGLRTAPVPATWWAPYAGLRARIDLGDTPWHERAAMDLWRAHGGDCFAGLELWGLPERLAGVQERSCA